MFSCLIDDACDTEYGIWNIGCKFHVSYVARDHPERIDAPSPPVSKRHTVRRRAERAGALPSFLCALGLCCGRGFIQYGRTD